MFGGLLKKIMLRVKELLFLLYFNLLDSLVSAQVLPRTNCLQLHMHQCDSFNHIVLM